MPKTTRRDAIAGAAALSALIATDASAKGNDSEETLSAAFHTDDLSILNGEQDGPWLKFFDNNTMFTGIYEIPAGGQDPQGPHKLDELYVVMKGRATLIAGDKEYDATSGSVFFVKTKVPHKFINIEEDLQVIVFFSKADPKGL